MKRIYCFLLFIILYSNINVFSQGANCAIATPFCAGGNTLTFQNSFGNTNTADPYIDYECLGGQSNPSWFYLKIGKSGAVDFEISQISDAGEPIDIDYIVWGPFPGPIDSTTGFSYCGPNNLNPSTSYSCSYSTSLSENFTITNAKVGQVYVFLLTNYSGLSGKVKIVQTNSDQAGAGATDCNNVCVVTISNPNPVVCPCETTTLTASISDASSYQWTSSTSGSILGNSQSITVTQSGVYTVVVNKPGCVANATASTFVQFIDYPHFFTPNGDGFNDTWNFKGLNTCAESIEKIKIFDRSGKLLKVITTTGDGWDGTYSGQELPADDYWFTVDYLEKDIPKQIKSHFSLKR